MKGIMKTLGTKVTRTVGRHGLILKKYSPELLMALGVAGSVVAFGMVIKATRELDDVLEDHEKRVEDVKDECEDRDEYKKELTKSYFETGFKLVKLYAPSVTLEIASIGCMLGAHGILKKRNVALMAAYKTLEESFTNYRKRVAEEVGEDREYELRHGITKEMVVETDENGKSTAKEVRHADPSGISQYAKFFDASSRLYKGIPEYDLLFLKSQESYFTDLLRTRGHLYLNEVYDALDIDMTDAGSVVGWILGEGDDFVDFGIFDDKADPARRAFVNGYEKDAILLDFNVSGPIYGKLGDGGLFRNRKR